MLQNLQARSGLGFDQGEQDADASVMSLHSGVVHRPEDPGSGSLPPSYQPNLPEDIESDLDTYAGSAFTPTASSVAPEQSRPSTPPPPYQEFEGTSLPDESRPATDQEELESQAGTDLPSYRGIDTVSNANQTSQQPQLNGSEPDSSTTMGAVASVVRSFTQATESIPSPQRRGYGPVSAAILEDVVPAAAHRSHETVQEPPRKRSNVARFSSTNPSAGNPYINIIQEQQDRMTINYLRNKEASTSTAVAYDTSGDFGFGLRYQQIEGVEAIMVTNQRKPAEVLSGSRECTVCLETKTEDQFLMAAISNACRHPPTFCRDCVKASIKAQIERAGFDSIRCPECNKPMEFIDIESYADTVDSERYRHYSIKNAIGVHADFVQCAHGCDYWKIHKAGRDGPVFTCERCQKTSCAVHKVPWHENLTCEEYNRLLADPENFRSAWELEQDSAGRQARPAVEATDWDVSRALLEREVRELAEERLSAERRERVAREACEFRERMEARERAEQLRKDMMKRKVEEQASERTVEATTKRCPNRSCQAPIEKNAGCQHMTCQKCKTQFCWGCNSIWFSGHSISCSI